MLFMRIGYPAGNNENPEIFTMNLDGSQSAAAYLGHALETSPQWLSNGLRIGYARYDGNFNIVGMNANGSGKQNLTSRGSTSPRWSPDGTKLAFHRSFVPGEQYRKLTIGVADADGSNERDLKRCCWPVWSPDGRQIAYSARRGIHITDSDGSHDRTIAHVPWLVVVCSGPRTARGLRTSSTANYRS